MRNPGAREKGNGTTGENADERLLLHERCQRENLVGRHDARFRMRRRIFSGPVRAKAVLRTLLRREGPPPVLAGRPSAFPAGSWVRVKSAASIRATLDPGGKLRGLLFMPPQWHTCGQIYRVQSHLRRMIDDFGVMRSISRTVILDDLTCMSFPGDAGCGRVCPLFYRDEWLEAAEPPADAIPPLAGMRPVRIRSEREIRATLDPGGGRQGLKFMAGMERYCGRAYAAREVDTAGEYGFIVPARAGFYVVPDLQCDGSPLGAAGPCERRCRLIWHRDWLELA